MAKARRRDLWDQTSALRSDLRNMFRADGQPALHPDELNPLREYQRPQRQNGNVVADLVSAFTGL